LAGKNFRFALIAVGASEVMKFFSESICFLWGSRAFMSIGGSAES
jgi:hypothetical protein